MGNKAEIFFDGSVEQQICSNLKYPWCQATMRQQIVVRNNKGVTAYTVTPLLLMARLERFELPTYGFVVRCSIQLSYKRELLLTGRNVADKRNIIFGMLKGMGALE